MKKPISLWILLLSVFMVLLCCSNFVCLAVDYSIIGEGIDKALKLKEAGDIDGAVRSIQKAMALIDAVESVEAGAESKPAEEDVYTKAYLQTLVECLKGDEIIYSTVIAHIAKVIQKTNTLFLDIADELKSVEISPENTPAIKEMKLELSRAMVTHSFCLPPAGYAEVYNVTQQALFWYSRAWNNLYLIAFEKSDAKTKLEAEALFSFQKGNELFSQAGTLMLAVPKK